MPTIQGIDAYDHGFDVPADYDAVFGSPAAVTTPLYQNRLNTLEFLTASGNLGIRKNLTGSPTLAWTGFPWRTNAYSTSPNLVQIANFSTGSQVGRIWLNPTGVYLNTVGTFGSITAVSLNTWYWIEVIAELTGTTMNLFGRINGVDMDSSSDTVTAGQTWSYIQLLSLPGDTAGVTTNYGGYWAWGTASSTADWLGEPSAEKQSIYMSRSRRVYR